MVVRLVAAGHRVVALVATDEQRRDLERLGADAARDVPEAGAQADVVVVCVFTDEQVRQVCLRRACPPAMPAVRRWWCTPPQARKLSRQSPNGARDVDVVDAPVSGGPHDIAAGLS